MNFKLKDFRIENGLKQSDLQEVLGCKQSFISRVENGREAFPANFVHKLIDVYGKEKVTRFCDSNIEEEISASKQSVPYEIVQAMIDERKRHDEMNAELIRQNGELIELLQERKKTDVRTEDTATCADAGSSSSEK
ncbi:helix-turn-helix transcriptional regulator [uncultured Bacteroides sp.]|uniref:helix-turn-helix domain-containing protein n=1 Tax=uncultured Bacteroides sp. TaxID=162156 RepID=UPI0025ADDA1C|nr:helix-turn-helix transcriptional regulator [uncultured Bacteroides sp.]